VYRFLIPVLAAFVGLGLLSLPAPLASAQYPPPAGSTVALVAGDIAPAVGDTVSIAATVTDPAGDPAAGVACTFAIASQPGGDASVEPGPVTTNADGVAATVLHIGSTGGTIVVETTCGELSSLITVVAGAAEEPEAPAAPPASQPDLLPTAGFGPGEATGVPSAYFLAALVLTLAVAVGTLYLIRRAW
jgi:hypothetical protein